MLRAMSASSVDTTLVAIRWALLPSDLRICTRTVPQTTMKPHEIARPNATRRLAGASLRPGFDSDSIQGPRTSLGSQHNGRSPKDGPKDRCNSRGALEALLIV